MYIIGITGGTGSGKTVALQILEQLGALRLDCDEIYHEQLKENEAMKAEISARFSGVLENGVINRTRLGEMVFNDKSALQELNIITHKCVIDEIKHRLTKWKKQGGTIAAIDAIALIESGANQLCDTTIGIIAPMETRIGSHGTGMPNRASTNTAADRNTITTLRKTKMRRRFFRAALEEGSGAEIMR
jgi:dephospho-CoA kinase